jgi:hypothetical protein
MEIQEETPRRNRSLVETINDLQKKLELEQKKNLTKEKSKVFKWPFKWKRKLKTAKRAATNEIMVIFLNKKNEVEQPKFMPIFDGNMVVYKNKPYEFDPRAVWTIKGFKGNPKVYFIKEIDRRPVRNKFNRFFYKDAAVSNMDLDLVRERGDSTESDEFLIKAALRAQKTELSKKKTSLIVILIIIAIVGGLLWFFLGG